MTEKQNNSDHEINLNPNGSRNAFIAILILVLLIAGTSIFAIIDLSEPAFIFIFYSVLIGSGLFCYFFCTGKIGNFNIYKLKFEEDIQTFLERQYHSTNIALVKIYIAERNFHKAITQLEAALSVDPTNVLLLFLLAESYEMARDKANAIRSYKKAIQHSHSSVRIYLESQLRRVITHGCREPGMEGLRNMSY